jgi:hypothetical protein
MSGKLLASAWTIVVLFLIVIIWSLPAIAGSKGQPCLCRGGQGMSVGMVLHKKKRSGFYIFNSRSLVSVATAKVRHQANALS